MHVTTDFMPSPTRTFECPQCERPHAGEGAHKGRLYGGNHLHPSPLSPRERGLAAAGEGAEALL